MSSEMDYANKLAWLSFIGGAGLGVIVGWMTALWFWVRPLENEAKKQV